MKEGKCIVKLALLMKWKKAEVAWKEAQLRGNQGGSATLGGKQ